MLAVAGPDADIHFDVSFVDRVDISPKPRCRVCSETLSRIIRDVSVAGWPNRDALARFGSCGATNRCDARGLCSRFDLCRTRRGLGRVVLRATADGGVAHRQPDDVGQPAKTHAISTRCIRSFSGRAAHWVDRVLLRARHRAHRSTELHYETLLWW